MKSLPPRLLRDLCAFAVLFLFSCAPTPPPRAIIPPAPPRAAPAAPIIAALPEPQRTVVLAAWTGDAKLARHGATVTALGAALGMTDAQLDALFIAADSLTI